MKKKAPNRTPSISPPPALSLSPPPALSLSPPPSLSPYPPPAFFLSPSSSLDDGDVSDPKVHTALPTDLITDIFLRLPVKTLCKCKCLSKQWLRLIADQQFVSTHRNLSRRSPNILLARKSPLYHEPHAKKRTRIDLRALNFHGHYTNHDFSFFVDDDENNIEMLPSKWDIVCFVSESGFIACNPSMQQVVKLPESSCCTSRDLNAGMGYDKEKDEYVLVHLFDRSVELHMDNDMGCEVLRLRDGGIECSWKVMDANCRFVVRGWGAMVENVFYWMIWDDYDQPGDEAIVSFDLVSEEFGTLNPPDGCLDPYGVWSLVELGGRLCLVDTAAKPLTMDIWILEDIMNQMWVLKYSISMNMYDIHMLSFIMPLEYLEGKILMDVKQESMDCYEEKTKCIKRMNHSIAGEWNWLGLYTESFLTLGGK